MNVWYNFRKGNMVINMFYESDIEKAIIELLIDKGYSYIDDTNNWVVERQLSDFINEELLLERLTIINKGVKNKILEEAIRIIKNIDHPSLFG